MADTLTNSGPLQADITSLEEPAPEDMSPGTDIPHTVSPLGAALSGEDEATDAITETGGTLSVLEAVSPVNVVANGEEDIPSGVSVPEEKALDDVDDAGGASVGTDIATPPAVDMTSDGTDGAYETGEGDETSETFTPEALPPVSIRLVPLPFSPVPGKHSRLFRAVVLFLFLLSISGTTIGAIFAFNYGVSAYTTYTELRSRADDGVTHLLNIKTIFTGLKAHPTGFLDSAKLHAAQKELTISQNDFQQVQYTLNHASIITTITTYLPQYRSEIVAAQALSRIGIDTTVIGQALVKTAITLAPTLRGSLLNSGSTPLVTASMLDLIRSTIDAILPNLSDIQVQSSKISFSALPINAHELDQLTQLLQAIPQAESDLLQMRALLGAAGWMLGVDSTRTFLVQTMDRAELRPTGGFTGQYGELSITGGRVAPFSLRDISLIEYVDNSPTIGLLAPSQYRSWWPFANWGLRDSNLSADFPTSAQIAISKYKGETGHQVDGVIMFTPFLIEHILDVVGPITVPGYNDTITAQNVEQRLHYYQQDNTGLAKQVVYQPGDNTTSSRKRFTSLLASLLMDKVRHAPPDEIIAIARQMLYDLKTKDLQVYVTNPQIESLLVQYGDAAQIDRSTTHDGIYVVQANVSASKASQYVQTSMHDTVSLDASGGATHLLQIRLVYNQIGPVYGYDTYHDYLRVYVPPDSKFLWGDGFDTGNQLCGADLVACPQYDVYPKDELLCPAGQFQPGAQAPSIADSDGGRWHPLDTVGPPTNMLSDEPGRAMFGGWVIVPKNCTMNVTLSWYVPPQGHSNPYSLLVQRQAGTFPELDLTILPPPADCATLHTAGQHFDGIMGEDMTFTLPSLAKQGDTGANCYTQPGI